MGIHIDKAIQKLEDTIDRLTSKYGINLSLMRRGIYEIPGSHHINFKSNHWSPIEKDLTPKTIATLYQLAHYFIAETGTETHILTDKETHLQDYKQLTRKSDDYLQEMILGHEALIGFSMVDFFDPKIKKLPISLAIDKSLGYDNAKPFMVKLVLLEQNLLALRQYLFSQSKEKGMPPEEIAHILQDYYALDNYCVQNLEIKAEELQKKVEEKKRKGLQNSNSGNAHPEKEDESAYSLENDLKTKLETIRKLHGRLESTSESDLHYGMLSAYFLLSTHHLDRHLLSRELSKIRKQVESHIEFDVYRTIFSYGMLLSSQNEPKRAKKFMDMAIEYASFSSPNCAFLERMYANTTKIYAKLLGALDVSGEVKLQRGEALKQKKHKPTKHRLLVNGQPSENISYEEFLQNYAEELSHYFEVKEISSADGAKEFNITSMHQGNEPVHTHTFMNLDPEEYTFRFAPDRYLGSKTNTISLYGPAFMNAALGSIIGLARFVLPIRYLNPKIALVDNEVPSFAFSLKKGPKKVYRFNKQKFTGALYKITSIDQKAEEIAYDTIERRTHFENLQVLKKQSAGYSLDSLIELSNVTDFVKNLTLTVGAAVLLEYALNTEDITWMPKDLTVFPIFFAATFAAFSGMLDKPVNLISNLMKKSYQGYRALVHRKPASTA
jgi:hypothetical protein